MIRDVLEQFSGYPGLFILCAVSGILFPVPEDIALLYAGIRLDSGEFSWPVAATVACTGVLLRDVTVYWIGRYLGDWVLTGERLRSIVGGAKMDRSRELVEHHGTASVLFGRLLVGMRTPVFLVAGASGVGFRKFLAVDTLGILITVPGVMLIGQWVGRPVIENAFWLMRSSRWAWGSLAMLLIVWFVVTRIRNRSVVD